MNSLIKIITTLAFIATSTGQLPKINKEVRISQYKLIQESQASKWPKALLLKEKKLKDIPKKTE